MTWRGRAALGVLALWALVSVVRIGKLIEPAEPPPGQAVASMLDFLRATIPSSEGVLYVLPGNFGEDTGEAPRLRYELYPRAYDDVRASQDESMIHQLMQSERLRFIVVPGAQQYPPTYFLRQTPAWLRRIDFDADRYVLEVVP